MEEKNRMELLAIYMQYGTPPLLLGIIITLVIIITNNKHISADIKEIKLAFKNMSNHVIWDNKFDEFEKRFESLERRTNSNK